MCDPRYLNCRSASEVAGLDRKIIGTDTLLGACPAGAQCIAVGKTRSAPPYFLERAECASSAPQIFFFSITLFCFIFIYNMLVQTLHFVKAYRRPPCPPPRKKTGGASNSFSGGKNRGAGFRSQRAGIGSDWKGRR